MLICFEPSVHITLVCICLPHSDPTPIFAVLGRPQTTKHTSSSLENASLDDNGFYPAADASYSSKTLLVSPAEPDVV